MFPMETVYKCSRKKGEKNNLIWDTYGYCKRMQQYNTWNFKNHTFQYQKKKYLFCNVVLNEGFLHLLFYPSGLMIYILFSWICQVCCSYNIRQCKILLIWAVLWCKKKERIDKTSDKIDIDRIDIELIELIKLSFVL